MLVSRDGAEYYLSQFQRSTILAVNNSEYTALLSAGRINVIRDVELRQRLTELYGWYPVLRQVHQWEQEEVRAAMEAIAPHVRFEPCEDCARPRTRVRGSGVDWLSEPRLAMHLAALVDYRSSLIDSYGARIADIEDTQRRIRAELDVDGGPGL